MNGISPVRFAGHYNKVHVNNNCKSKQVSEHYSDVAFKGLHGSVVQNVKSKATKVVGAATILTMLLGTTKSSIGENITKSAPIILTEVDAGNKDVKRKFENGYYVAEIVNGNEIKRVFSEDKKGKNIFKESVAKTHDTLVGNYRIQESLYEEKDFKANTSLKNDFKTYVSAKAPDNNGLLINVYSKSSLNDDNVRFLTVVFTVNDKEGLPVMTTYDIENFPKEKLGQLSNKMDAIAKALLEKTAVNGDSIKVSIAREIVNVDDKINYDKNLTADEKMKLHFRMQTLQELYDLLNDKSLDNDIEGEIINLPFSKTEKYLNEVVLTHLFDLGFEYKGSPAINYINHQFLQVKE